MDLIVTLKNNKTGDFVIKGVNNIAKTASINRASSKVKKKHETETGEKFTVVAVGTTTMTEDELNSYKEKTNASVAYNVLIIIGANKFNGDYDKVKKSLEEDLEDAAFSNI